MTLNLSSSPTHVNSPNSEQKQTSSNSVRASTKLPSNPLLVKCTVGKPRPTCYQLPPESHIYGKKADSNTNKNNFQFWGPSSKTNLEKTSLTLDYIAMNKYYLREKVLNVKEQSDLRHFHPIHAPMVTTTTRIRTITRPLPSDSNPHFTYGKPTRPSSPVGEVISGYYMQTSMNSCKKHEDQNKKDKVNLKSKKKKGTSVPSSVQYNPVRKVTTSPKINLNQDPKTYFKMPRFKDIPARIVSHWDTPLPLSSSPSSSS